MSLTNTFLNRSLLRSIEAEEPPKPAPEPNPFPAVPCAQIRPRHWVMMASFAVLVMVPVIATMWYLHERAAARYVSKASFTVRTEEPARHLDLFGAMTNISGASSSDPDILYRFIQSQQLVIAADRVLDLRTLWQKGNPDQDPLFAYHAPGTIEDLVHYWGRMVSVYADSVSGLIDVEVQAFTPQDAQRINRFIYEESSAMMNRLSSVMREDTTRHARENLAMAVKTTKAARAALTEFRNLNQIIDPHVSMESQMGILASLQNQLAETLIDLDLLMQSSTHSGDPRVARAQRRMDAIETRIAQERGKLGLGRSPVTVSDTSAEEQKADTNKFSDLVGEYERLLTDLEFAEETLASARVSYDAALAEANRQTRYLAAHVQPTIAESASYPNVAQTLPLVGLFSFLLWSIVVLVVFALWDRR